jgi:Dyp-type peroxidase family
MSSLELTDMQGLLARGYGGFPVASYLLLQVEDGPGAQAWLRSIHDEVTPAAPKPDETALQVAFTCDGLRALGLEADTLRTFDRAFWEGMHVPHRQRILGDDGDSAPEHWRWGNAKTPVDVLVMLFAADAEAHRTLLERVRAGLEGVSETEHLETHWFEPTREHFGFRDGISQPIVEGLSRDGPPENTVPPGEFFLGYPNAYVEQPARPSVARTRDPEGLLPRVETEQDGPRGDLGRNGTYIVFRQLRQDVQGFWRFVTDASEAIYDSADARERLAAKMVGRWRDGAPLTLSPDDPDGEARDDFGYAEKDADGSRCPFSAHLRRSNPRDSLEGGPEQSTTVANRHRLLRRGRPYGPPIAEDFDVDEILAADDEAERGLHFVCLCGDIARQFEFTQQTWIENQKFGGQYDDPDPLMGSPQDEDTTFTIPDDPVRRRVTDMQRFVEVRGGSYFFMPSRSALRFLGRADLPG